MAPSVMTADLKRELCKVLKPRDVARAMSIEDLANKAGVSVRTVYRVLEEDKPTKPLGTADALLTAAGSHLRFVRIVGETDG